MPARPAGFARSSKHRGNRSAPTMCCLPARRGAGAPRWSPPTWASRSGHRPEVGRLGRGPVALRPNPSQSAWRWCLSFRLRRGPRPRCAYPRLQRRLRAVQCATGDSDRRAGRDSISVFRCVAHAQPALRIPEATEHLVRCQRGRSSSGRERRGEGSRFLRHHSSRRSRSCRSM